MTTVARLTALAACVAMGLCGQIAGGQDMLTYENLVKRLMDLERLAVLPAPGERLMQQSSYDRRSRYDEKTGKYVDWGANGDGTGFIRAEGESIIIAEMDGPGCIWRIWSAKADDGHVKVFLDGSAEPAIDLPFKQYFDRTARPFSYPSLVYAAARGLNCYVPIPFARSCRIVAEKGWGRYYHFTYGLFPKGTQVDSMRLPLAKPAEDALAAADGFLSSRMGEDPAGRRDGEAQDGKTVAVAAGKAETVAELAGPRAITALKVRIDLPDRQDQMDALRELVLRIAWDGEESPSVWCPLGDLFGTAPGVNEYKSLPLGMTKDGFYSFWYMPFARSAKIELVNDGKKDRNVEFQIAHAPLSRPAEKLGRFHCKWHRDAFLPKDKDRFPDWTLLTTTGRGRFVGVMLHVWNPKGGQYPPAGEGRYWWGEGDEKFFVDGRKFPCVFGTGSEDYFGYAWGNATLFARAFHNQTISMDNKGHISVNRWHIADDAPFQKSFEGCIEKYFPNDWPTRYAATVYWYQAPGGGDPYGPVPAGERMGYYEMPRAFRAAGAVEGEAMKVLQVGGGKTQRQALDAFGADSWSEGAQLWWTGGKSGDRLILALPVAKAGRYSLAAAMTKARDYAIVQLYLDGKKLGEPLDLFDTSVVPTKAVPLGAHDLSAGEHQLAVEIVAANDKALKAYMFGLDYVILKPAD